jgi:hypothetical protein
MLAACASDDTGGLPQDASPAHGDAGHDSEAPDATVADQRDQSVPVESSADTGMSDGMSETPPDVQPDVASDEGTLADVTRDVSAEVADAGPSDVSVIESGGGDSQIDGDGKAVDGGAAMCTSICRSGQKLCGGTCVDINDPAYGCDPVVCASCTIPSYATAIKCSAGSCAVDTCMPGRSDCDGNFGNGCEADLGRSQTCGSCSHACNPGQVCDGQTCAAVCTFGKTNCNGACHDLTNDPVACGGCTSSCDPGAGTATCNAGQCSVTCAPGAINMCFGNSYGRCFYGRCGCDVFHTCAPQYPQGSYCQDNQCLSSCGAGFSTCGNSCVDESTDAKNCGACGNACPNGQICVSKNCVTLASTQVAVNLVAPEGIAVDAHNVYFTDSSDNSVWQVDKQTLVAKRLASDQRKPWRITVDGTYVYWTSTLGGAVLRTPIGTPGFEPLYSTNGAEAILVDDTNVYWSQVDGVWSASKAGGGTPRMISTRVPTLDPLVQTATSIYTAPSSVLSIDKVSGAEQFVWRETARMRSEGVAAAGSSLFYLYAGQCDVTCTMQLCRLDTSTGSTLCDPVWAQAAGFMAAEPCGAYWGLPGAIYAANPGSVPSHALIRASISPRQLAVDESNVYWVDSTWIGRVPKL